MIKRRLLTLVFGASLLALVPAQGQAVASDWWLLKFTAGDSPAHFTYRLEYEARANGGPGPLIHGFGYGWVGTAEPGGAVFVYPSDDDGTYLRTTNGYGSLDVQVAPRIPLIWDTWLAWSSGEEYLPARGTFYLLQFWANGSFTPPPISLTVLSGDVDFTQETGTGARAILVADPSNDGKAVQAAGVTLGQATATATLAHGIAGGFYYCDECAGTWRAPGGSDVTWRGGGDMISGSRYVENAWFAGGPGSWRWTWEGQNVYAVPDSGPFAAYAPVGDAWPAFACRYAQSSACSRRLRGIFG